MKPEFCGVLILSIFALCKADEIKPVTEVQQPFVPAAQISVSD
jgi:hypothetical protein